MTNLQSIKQGKNRVKLGSYLYLTEHEHNMK